MTTINITRRKEAIGFISKMTVTAKDGQSVSIKAGETATLTTTSPVEELYVKRFWRTQVVKTGVADSNISGTVNLELFHNLPVPAMYLMLVVSGLLVATSLSGFSSKRYISISLYLILIALIAKTRQGSITFKRL
ncbi:MAG: hypothetical protein J0I41_04680 [Filimonas sp.]|nr:hypothetical protein [Filimonas sp.]